MITPENNKNIHLCFINVDSKYSQYGNIKDFTTNQKLNYNKNKKLWKLLHDENNHPLKVWISYEFLLS